MSRLTACFVVLSLAAGLHAQDKPKEKVLQEKPGQQERRDDMRDKVTLETDKTDKGGKVVQGRVVEQFNPKELVVMQGSKRVRIPREQVAEVVTVNDHLREFFARRDKLQNNVAHDWILAEWAASVGLDSMARLQAYLVLVQSPGHVPANTMLGHKKQGDEWQWVREGRYMSREKFEQYTSDWGHPLSLTSEHFRLRTDAGVLKAADALMDLERLYLWWFDQFGQKLQLREALKLMDVHVWKSKDEFPAASSAKHPYVVPYPFEDVSYTYFAGLGERPVQLFSVGTQHILYRCLVVATSLGSRLDRLAAWLEVGLGMYVENLFQGPPGSAHAGTTAFNLDQAHTVLEAKERKSLKNLIHQPYASFLTPNEETPLLWASVTTLVTYLMEHEGSPETRDQLLEFTRRALGEPAGDSSSLFDEAMGFKVETLERPWLDWLEKRSGMEAKGKGEAKGAAEKKSGVK